MRTIVTFDGQSLTDLFYVSDLQAPLLPRDIATTDVPGRDGTIVTGAPLSARTIRLRLTVRGRTIEDRRAAERTLAGILAVDEPKPLAMSIDGGLYWLAVPNASSNGERFLNADRFDVEFLCADPVAYGEERTVTVPSGGSVTFDVGGTYPTTPVVSAPAAKPSGGVWGLLDSYDSTQLTVQLAGTRAVVADCGRRVLTVAGATTLLVPTSDWLVLAPGRHTLTMTGTGAATLTYRERWL